MRTAFFPAFLLACNPATSPIEPAAPALVPESFFAAHGVDWSDEIVAERTAHSLTFRQPDGQRVAVLGTSALAYLDADEGYKLVEARIREVGSVAPDVRLAPLSLGRDVPEPEGTLTGRLPGSGGVSPGAYRWADEANTLQSYFPEDPREGVLTVVGKAALRWVPESDGGGARSSPATGFAMWAPIPGSSRSGCRRQGD